MLVVPSLVASQQELHNEEKKKQINGLISYNDSTHLRGNPKPRPQAKDDPKPRPAAVPDLADGSRVQRELRVRFQELHLTGLT